MTFKNVFKCECGNHAFFMSREPVKKGSTFETECSYELERKIMQFVKSVEVEK